MYGRVETQLGLRSRNVLWHYTDRQWKLWITAIFPINLHVLSRDVYISSAFQDHPLFSKSLSKKLHYTLSLIKMSSSKTQGNSISFVPLTPRLVATVPDLDVTVSPLSSTDRGKSTAGTKRSSSSVTDTSILNKRR